MTRRVLIRAIGAARPGQLAGLGKALATSGARLLDINQSVTFGMLSLEALVGLDHEATWRERSLPPARPWDLMSRRSRSARRTTSAGAARPASRG